MASFRSDTIESLLTGMSPAGELGHLLYSVVSGFQQRKKEYEL